MARRNIGSRYRVPNYYRGVLTMEQGLVPCSRSKRRRNRYRRSGFDRDLIIRLLAPMAPDVINATIGATARSPFLLCLRHILQPSSCLSVSPVSLLSSLIPDGTLPGKLGKSTTYSFFFFVPKSPLPFRSLFRVCPVSLPSFCARAALKRGIKWPWIGQEVGVSP